MLSRRTLLILGVGFAGGVLFAVATRLSGLSAAAPVELTTAQAAQLVAEHRGVISRFAHHDAGGWRCTWLAQMDRFAFRRAGVPDDAMQDVDVWTPRGWATPKHRLLRVDAVVEGRPWRPMFDMNSPWPLDDRQARAWGYRFMGKS